MNCEKFAVKVRLLDLAALVKPIKFHDALEHFRQTDYAPTAVRQFGPRVATAFVRTEPVG
jgi:hypothetical protein